MPYTATSPTLTFCDKLAAVIAAAWNPTAPSAVLRCYQFTFDTEATTGRRVYVMPTDYGNEPATRSEDDWRHKVTVVIAERYTVAGEVSTEWIDERVDFVYDRIVDGLDYSHAGPLVWSGRSVLTLGADVEVCDLDTLRTKKTFWSVVNLEFLEILNA